MKENKRVKKSKIAKAANVFIDFTGIRAGNLIQYKMPIGIYNDLVHECKKTKRGDIQKFLCNYVNDEYGLLGTCIRVLPE